MRCACLCGSRLHAAPSFPSSRPPRLLPQRLTVGSSGSICAPWSLISIFGVALRNGHRSPLSVCVSPVVSGCSRGFSSLGVRQPEAAGSLCLIFGSGRSEAGGTRTPQLTGESHGFFDSHPSGGGGNCCCRLCCCWWEPSLQKGKRGKADRPVTGILPEEEPPGSTAQAHQHFSSQSKSLSRLAAFARIQTRLVGGPEGLKTQRLPRAPGSQIHPAVT